MWRILFGTSVCKSGDLLERALCFFSNILIYMKYFCSYRYLSSVPSLQPTAFVTLHSTLLTSLLYVHLCSTEVSALSTSMLYYTFLLYLPLCCCRYLFVTLVASLYLLPHFYTYSLLLHLPLCFCTYLVVAVLTSLWLYSPVLFVFGWVLYTCHR